MLAPPAAQAMVASQQEELFSQGHSDRRIEHHQMLQKTCYPQYIGLLMVQKSPVKAMQQ